MGSFSYTLKCKLQPLNCLTLIGTEGQAEIEKWMAVAGKWAEPEIDPRMIGGKVEQR
jgi:hypothetical protein